MSIKLECENCGRKIQTRDEFLGKRVRCPRCKTPIQVVRNAGDGSSLDWNDIADLERSTPSAEGQREAECPQCGQEFTAKSRKSGRRVQCPICGHVFKLEDADAVGGTYALSAVDSTDSAMPTPSLFPQTYRDRLLEKETRRRHVSGAGWVRTQQALMLIASSSMVFQYVFLTALALSVGTMAAIFGAIAPFVVTGLSVVALRFVVAAYSDYFVQVGLFVLGAVLAPWVIMSLPPGFLIGFAFCILAAILLASLGMLVGMGMLCAVPAESGVRWFAVGATSLLLIFMACSGAGLAKQPIFVLPALLSFLFAYFLFAFSLRQLAMFFADEPTIEYVGSYNRFAVVVFVVCLLFSLFIAWAVAISGSDVEWWLVGLAAVFSFIMNVLYSANFIWLTRVVNGVRDLVRVK